MAWSDSDIDDQSGRTFVVTGANSGLGLVTARILAAHGARVVMACRNLAKAEQAQRTIEGDTLIEQLDLGDLASVHAFAERYTGPVDVLFNNAGVYLVGKSRTADGFEQHFGVNHLGHFALTALLLPRVTDRVVTVSSLSHRVGRLNLADPNYEHRPYTRLGGYAQSKLADLMCSYELQHRLEAAGSPVRAVAAHPGFAAANLDQHVARFGAWFRPFALAMCQLEEIAVLPGLYAATVPDMPGGGFVGPERFGQTRGYPVPVTSSRTSRDRRLQQQVWELSERLTGVVHTPAADRPAA